MYKFLLNNGQRLAFLVGIAITALFIIIAVSGQGKFAALSKEEQPFTSIFDFGLVGALVLTVVAAGALILFGLLQTASNFKGSLKGIIGFAALVAVFIISYATASGQPSGPIAEAVEKVGGISAGNLKFIGGGITTTLVLVAVATLAFVISELRNFFK